MADQNKRPLVLMILDGWGVSARLEGNAVARAHTPNYDEIRERYPSTILAASGPHVGLADGEAGNAEIGHRTIGAGRVIQTEAARIARAVASGEFLDNDVLRSAMAHAVEEGSALHFVGLLGDGGVHSSQETLFSLLRMAKAAGAGEAFVHCILDGRDVSPRTADIYVEALEIKMADIGIGKIASLCGRFYAMDAGENWERTARAYTMLVHGEGERGFDAVTAVRASFLRGISDEFISPIVIESKPDEPVATMKGGDLAIFFNHTGGPMRQLVRSLALPDAASPRPMIRAVCLTEYDPTFGLPVAFRHTDRRNMLAAVLEQQGVKNYRISETGRSPHISTFFNGQANSCGDLERRAFLQSSGPEAFDLGPESKSFKIADTVIRGLEAGGEGVFVVNFCAPAMLAERGDLDKTIDSIQFVDTCLGGVVERVIELGGVALVTSSHAGCEAMGLHESHNPRNPAPTNPVSFHLIDAENPDITLAADGSLADVAPTILGLLGIEKPPEMTGRDLRIL